MESINDRIAQCVKDSGLTKTAFAAKINVSQGFISNLCIGEKVPSDRTIADICREFMFLRYGSVPEKGKCILNSPKMRNLI